MSKLNMKEWINEIIQKKEVVAMPIMTPSPHSMGALVPFVSLWRNCFLIMGCLKECFSSFYPEVFPILCRP